MDPKAQLLLKKPEFVYCSCGSTVKMKQLYDTTCYKDHKMTYSPGTSILSYFEFKTMATPQGLLRTRNCPGLRSEAITAYIERTPMDSGGSRRFDILSQDVFGKRMGQLSKEERSS
jgi:hypothetical protein